MNQRKLISATALLTVSFATFLIVAQAQPESPELSQSPPICAPELLMLKCEDHSKSPLDLRKTRSEADGIKFNYFLWGKREHHQKLEKFALASSDADQTRALGLVDVARKYAILYLTGGRDPSAWSIETRTMVERIKQIEFKISDPYSSDCFDATDPGLPQAAYSPMEHSIGLCHSLVKTHSNVILATILHEIGHAVSTCNMKKPLLRHKELTSEAFSCLNAVYSDLVSNEERSEAEDADRTLAKSISEIKIGLDVNATNTETMLRCGAVERIPNSSLESVQGNIQFDQCARLRFAKDYDRYVAKFALGQDALPRGLIEREKNIVNKFKEDNPQSCFRKSEEHFADSFSAQAMALWHKSENKNREDFRLAVYDLGQTYCMGRLESRNVSNSYLYPADDVRLLSYLAPSHFQSQIGCANLPKPVCTLPEDPAGLTSSSPSRSSKRGTAK